MVKTQAEEIDARAIKCRSWLCPTCFPGRKDQLVAELIGGRPNISITITQRHPRQGTDAEKAKKQSWAIRRWVERAEREAARDPRKDPLPFGAWAAPWDREVYPHGVPRQVELVGGRFPFQAVREKTKQGAPHCHILGRAKWISQEWLSQQMAELDDSPRVWVERIVNKGQAALYAAKYAGKAAEKFGTAKRYWKTRDYDLREAYEPPAVIGDPAHFRVEQRPLAHYVRDLRVWGYRLEVISQWRVKARPPPGGLFGNEARGLPP